MKETKKQPISLLSEPKRRHKAKGHISYSKVVLISSACQPCARVIKVQPHQLISEDRNLESGRIPNIIERITDFNSLISNKNFHSVL